MTTLQDTGKFRSNTKDQFYTKPTVAAACVARILTVWLNEVTEVTGISSRWIEPSAGGGAFVTAAAAAGISDIVAMDVAPTAAGIETADFLKWTAPTGAASLVFGNPPFGRQGSLAKAFIARAASFASRIAFILPRSFQKPSMSRAFPPEFHCIWSEELSEDSFLVNGKSHAVPCVFQLWERRIGVPRELMVAAEAEGFSYVKSTESHDFVVRRVGVRAGAAMVAAVGVSPSPQSHHFIRIADDVREAISITEITTKISAHIFPTNTTGPRSLTKSEINGVINAILAEALDV
jgi:hypothetical protein